jgi:CRP-like cAMP-binding protein
MANVHTGSMSRSTIPVGALFPVVPPARDADAAALQRAATKVRFSRDETIFNDGDLAQHAYKVISGVVRLCKHMPDGRRQIAGFCLPGEFFGLLELGEYSYSAEAVTNLVLSSYPLHVLDLLADERPALRRQFINSVVRRIEEMQDQIVLLGRQTAKERIAAFLVALSRRTGGEDDIVDVPMSRQDMADFLGLTVETVCRALSDLKASGDIEAIDLRQFRLRGIAALRELAANT